MDVQIEMFSLRSKFVERSDKMNFHHMTLRLGVIKHHVLKSKQLVVYRFW